MNNERAEYLQKMRVARERGNWKAYKDLKKHYDKIIRRERNEQTRRSQAKVGA